MPGKRTIHIEVTPEDIARGDAGSPDSCPIALAMLRLPGCKQDHYLSVDSDEISFMLGKEYLAALPPPEAEDFIESFDAGNPVHPFAFDLEIYDESEAE